MCKFFIHLSCLTLLLLVLSCSSPLKEHSSQIDPESQTSAILSDSSEFTKPDRTISLPITVISEVELSLHDRMEEIERLVPANTHTGWEISPWLNLYSDEIKTIKLTIDDTISFALANNLDIQIATLNPSISEQSVVEAEAAFDFVF